jgi:hypothetical protein
MTLPERVNYSLTESALPPFPAEPAQAGVEDCCAFCARRMQFVLEELVLPPSTTAFFEPCRFVPIRVNAK